MKPTHKQLIIQKLWCDACAVGAGLTEHFEEFAILLTDCIYQSENSVSKNNLFIILDYVQKYVVIGCQLMQHVDI